MEEVLTRDPKIAVITERLADPFDPKDVKYKPSMVKNNRCLAMCYIDARLIQDRLDDVLGTENWEDEYEVIQDGSVMCRLRLKLGGVWVTKTDVGSPSEQPDVHDRMKAAFSDALKRAAVKFGIGRYLYRLSSDWVDYDPVKKKIVQLPRLPDFALPAAMRGQGRPAAPRPAQASSPPPPAAAQTRAQKAAAAPPADALPKTGDELARRVREFEDKLVEKKLCAKGALAAHLINAGKAAGYPADVQKWSGTEQMDFAVRAVKEFQSAIGAAAAAK